MEYNKDESFRCLKIAKECLATGDFERALKFINKSKQLYPLSEADELLSRVEQNSHNDTTVNGAHFHQPSSNFTRNRSAQKASAAPSQSEGCTQEQIDSVNRIKRCKDYYEILGISKDADDNELKRKYRKLALQFHPDKNKAPGALEAFKAIGNAFSVLSDPDKRRKYDLCEPATRSNGRTSRSNSYEWDYSHGFEADMTPEEIFQMFFGHTTNVSRRAPQSTAHTFRRFQHSQQQENWPQLLLQLSPILVLCILSLLSMMFVSENPYSFTETSRHNIKKTTERLKVPYYVTTNFVHSGTDLVNLESEIEGLHIQSLQQKCSNERESRESQLRRARSLGDQKAYKTAKNLHLEYCQQLEEINTKS